MELRVLAFVLAGGKGTRLYPLTKERAKRWVLKSLSSNKRMEIWMLSLNGRKASPQIQSGGQQRSCFAFARWEMAGICVRRDRTAGDLRAKLPRAQREVSDFARG